MTYQPNRKLLVSVFNPQEAREAILGGGRIIDSEDPRSALGNIKPRQIAKISQSVLSYKWDNDVQLSTNIGEDQLLFDRRENGIAIQKSDYEICGKSAQSALGVACAMGNVVHPVAIIKVGVDGMPVALVGEVLTEVQQSLKETSQFRTNQVMAVLFAQDIAQWQQRKTLEGVRGNLISLREFYPCDQADKGSFNLLDYAKQYLLDDEGKPLFTQKKVSLADLVAKGVLPASAKDGYVKLCELVPHEDYFPNLTPQSKTTEEVIKAMVDVAADSGADSIMLDTRIQSKAARICVVDTGQNDDLIDINQFDYDGHALARVGILTLDELRFFVEYCHYRNIEANVAGSVQSYQAQQLWCEIPGLDQISTRGAASGLLEDPSDSGRVSYNSRQYRIIQRHLVRGLAAPEHGGVLNFPEAMRRNPVALEAIFDLRARLAHKRQQQGLPPLQSYFVDAFGRYKLIQ